MPTHYSAIVPVARLRREWRRWRRALETGPVLFTRLGRPALVALSVQDYARLTRHERTPESQ